MRDPRCWREVLIRGGMTTVLVAVLYFAEELSPWVWLIPPAIIGLVLLRWAVRRADWGEDVLPADEDAVASRDEAEAPDDLAEES
jgi:hypothetical protein